ncbi:hypothetical protein E3P92_00860 [Wallemia ichthyophaga]|uniref:DUF1772-domain-containing protein n=2 Tax=Wallemia ichthyophaga TaxID=245174 RepID=A0A4T0HP32_WALIC|nr:uncharacterized protein J056_003734 [Wallemia ichthyophaga EXF-994]TIA75093.1 hypothetical protein E3P91_00596 [Wallemia ichthyophaga]EOR02058.1 hypothetical protein J056_003734 [Wallemia ichthyophaga EXF-994]TIA83731.1 hypothetical protein E3P98_00588 [Wallemia ichthyophaga]TIA93709.1 hypothetical protein E3P97_00765 [Wallemia ichthyophaga]TIB02580.1 hypothetical protein E3P95_00814 [Wallemia ichthyophaga]
MSKPSILLALGTGFAGITTGFTASWPLIWYSPLSNASNSNTVKLLHHSYKNAVKTIPPLVLTATACFSVSAYLSNRAVLSAPAILIFSLFPYTRIFVLPVNKKLFKKTNEPEGVVDRDNTVNALLYKWMLIHCGRIALAAASTTLGFVQLLQLIK